MPVYLVFLLTFFAVPALLFGWLRRKEILRYWRTVLWCLVFVYTIGGLWDWLSYRTGVWRYDTARTVGIWLDGLPVEEFVGFYVLGTLFIIAVVFTVLRVRVK